MSVVKTVTQTSVISLPSIIGISVLAGLHISLLPTYVLAFLSSNIIMSLLTKSYNNETKKFSLHYIRTPDITHTFTISLVTGLVYLLCYVFSPLVLSHISMLGTFIALHYYIPHIIIAGLVMVDAVIRSQTKAPVNLSTEQKTKSEEKLIDRVLNNTTRLQKELTDKTTQFLAKQKTEFEVKSDTIHHEKLQKDVKKKLMEELMEGIGEEHRLFREKNTLSLEKVNSTLTEHNLQLEALLFAITPEKLLQSIKKLSEGTKEIINSLSDNSPFSKILSSLESLTKDDPSVEVLIKQKETLNELKNNILMCSTQNNHNKSEIVRNIKHICCALQLYIKRIDSAIDDTTKLSDADTFFRSQCKEETTDLDQECLESLKTGTKELLQKINKTIDLLGQLNDDSFNVETVCQTLETLCSKIAGIPFNDDIVTLKNTISEETQETRDSLEAARKALKEFTAGDDGKENAVGEVLEILDDFGKLFVEVKVETDSIASSCY